MPIRGNSSLKMLDRVLGIPLLRMLSLFPAHPRVDPSTIRRIGFLKTAAIGDTLLLTGPIEDVRQKYPAAELTLVTGEDNREAAELLGARVDRRLVVSPRRPFAAIRVLRRERFDALIDFGSWPRFDAVITALSAARVRAGFETRGQSRHHAYDIVVEHSGDVHEIDNYRRLVSVLGVASHSDPQLEPMGTLARDRIPSGAFVVFNPGAGGFKGTLREWPPSSWVELGMKLHRRGWEIVITGGRADTERADMIASALTAFGCRAHSVAGDYTLAELTDVLVASEAVISVNTGVMHLAAMLGVLTIALNGPTSERRWGPLGPRAHSVNSPLPECGFLNLGFEYGDNRLDCMSGITPDMVDAAVGSALPSRGARV
jgi:heptosyltransferase III